MGVLPVLVGLLGVLTLASLIRRAHWPAELLTHLRPHLVVAGLGGAALSALLGEQWEWAAISLGLALVNYGALPAPLWIKPQERLTSTPGISVAWANVWKKRHALERTLEWAKAQNADMILIGEFPDGDPAEFLSGDYPHRFDTGPTPREVCVTRIVVFSRTPLEGVELLPGPGPHHRPWVTCHVRVGETSLNVVAVHPTPPTTSKLQQERDVHIAAIGKRMTEPFVLAGDFNATPWCPAFNLIPGRRVGGYLFAPTWFSNLPLLGLPIDHIMVSPALKASAYRVAPSTGSDHRALLARVHLPESKA